VDFIVHALIFLFSSSELIFDHDDNASLFLDFFIAGDFLFPKIRTRHSAASYTNTDNNVGR